MVNPTGYTALDLVGFTDKGDYDSSETYVKNDLVHYQDQIWKCLLDDITGVTPTEGLTWTVWIDAANSLSGLTDASITNATDGEELTFDATAQKWKNTSKIQTLTNNVDSIYEVMGQNGAKNLLPNNATSQTIKGVTFTVNDDGTVTANGTATAIAEFMISTMIPMKKGKYILSSGSNIPANIYWSVQTTTGWKDVTNGANKVVFTENSDFNILKARLYIASGVTVSNLTLYPMLRLASDTDPTYQPYAETNQQLTTDKVGMDLLSEVGGVNYFNNVASTNTSGEVTYTIHDDKHVTVEVVSTLNATNACVLNEDFVLKKGTYKLVGCPDDVNNQEKLRLDIYTADNASVITVSGSSDGAIFTLASDTHVRLKIRCGSGLTSGTYTFYPMVIPPSYNGPYVPYAMTNRELTDSVSALSSEKLSVIKEKNPTWHHKATITCDMNSAGLAYLFTNAGLLLVITASGGIVMRTGLAIQAETTTYFKTDITGLSADITAWQDAAFETSKNALWSLIPINGNWTMTF